ncbi:uncharacterized protein [Physcomitrium patens]|uniref:Coenzyme Q-binding protein COQ10 START domain-containing protein n=1 Tax=Physcomitrium patens TaxID=3218 RepID=A0A2K1KB62_PHYPA|nr:uncharacterized protein LOC112284595 isoform X1 [Physcomitrium patens]PNR51015.1 hypothetical protein PHYPA_010201 [Physcomitrium patens]|eukprot:XP_024380282.1 uncharacterized protein LOC112284595 isoform X1 [Physcomitrella patens]
MAKNTADGFASNRRSPTLLRRKREMELRALRDGDEFGNLAGGSGSVNLRRSSYPSARAPNSNQSGPAEVSVQRKNGVFEVKGVMSMAVDPDITYGILVDYENNSQIFKTVSKVEVEYKGDMKLVTQHAHWNLMFWSGKFTIKMRVEEDRSKHKVAFKLNEPGFLKLFNGYWGIEPWIQEGKQVGSKVLVTQEVLPSILPPGPLGGYVSRIMGNQVKAALQDLSVEAERLQQSR